MARLMAAVEDAPEAVEAALGGAAIVETADAARLGAIGAALAGRAATALRVLAPDESETSDFLATLGPEGRPDHLLVVFDRADDAAALTRVGAALAAAGATPPRTAVLRLGDEEAEPVPPAEVAAAGFAALHYELADPARGGLLGRIAMPRLDALARACRAAGLGLGFGGALEAPDVPRLLALEPDVLAFDAALRADGGLRRAAVAEIAALFQPDPAAGWSDETDRIFVHDKVMEMAIGAYRHERGRQQRVRFGVEAEIRRPPSGASGMNAVYSYDLITDAIEILAARAHVDFVEVLAEDLAAILLADRRVASLKVRVEKLDLGAGAVGIEIHRIRRD
ncbi:hypothetical protein GCM10011390_44760 [Aureimonas endophytica]|uniref:(5-formylfuran-3-yl)methyl phosphate synthase n=1 Tax=Aureimonas endophytica TaxID=2027858 RepID=A0A917ED02_9HYPH|nr:dihydroneopterin aldolase [Aureimonas endophytica]GGE20523.1 hypothetical protein GCM10011390_44760 [Aureimonas endophytica]